MLNYPGLQHLVPRLDRRYDRRFVRTVNGTGPDADGNVAVEGGGGSYTLPTASAEVKGGVRIGSGLTMTGEVLSADAALEFSFYLEPANWVYSTYSKQLVTIPGSGPGDAIFIRSVEGSYGAALPFQMNVYNTARYVWQSDTPADDTWRFVYYNSGETITQRIYVTGYILHGQGDGITSWLGNATRGMQDLDIQVAVSDWQSGQPWPDGGVIPLGESASTCYLATITRDVNGKIVPCESGGDFKPRAYSRELCPAPLWIYIGNQEVYVATTSPPTQTITIRGAVILP